MGKKNCTNAKKLHQTQHFARANPSKVDFSSKSLLCSKCGQTWLNVTSLTLVIDLEQKHLHPDSSVIREAEPAASKVGGFLADCR